MNERAVSRELLEATQQAVVGAAGNVENMLQNTAGELAGGEEAFYLSAEFWVAAAFVLLVVALFLPLKKRLSAYLDGHIAREKGRLDEAERIKKEACKLMAVYEEKLDNLEAETKAVVDNARKEAAYGKKKMTAELEQKISLREKNIALRMQGDISRAESRLTGEMAEYAVLLLEKALQKKLDDKSRSRLIDESIERISAEPRG